MLNVLFHPVTRVVALVGGGHGSGRVVYAPKRSWQYQKAGQ